MMSTTCGRILSRTRCTTASTSAGSGSAGSDGATEAAGFGDATGLGDAARLRVATGPGGKPRLGDAAALGACIGLTAPESELACVGAGSCAEGPEIETACGASTSCARSSRLSVIFAHLIVGSGDAAGLGACRGLTAADCAGVCTGAGTWVEGTEIETACGASTSCARSSRLSVISAHLTMGTDRAVSSGACGACGEILAAATSLAFLVCGSATTSECTAGLTASIDLK